MNGNLLFCSRASSLRSIGSGLLIDYNPSHNLKPLDDQPWWRAGTTLHSSRGVASSLPDATSSSSRQLSGVCVVFCPRAPCRGILACPANVGPFPVTSIATTAALRFSPFSSGPLPTITFICFQWSCGRFGTEAMAACRSSWTRTRSSSEGEMLPANACDCERWRATSSGVLLRAISVTECGDAFLWSNRSTVTGEG